MESSEVFTAAVTVYPELMAGITLLLGLILARVLRAVTRRGLLLLNRSLARFGSDRNQLLGEATQQRLAGAVFWIVAVIAVLLSLNTLGMGRVFTWLDVPLSYLPQLLVGLAIIAAAHLLGVFARLLLDRLHQRPDEGALTGRAAQLAILIIGVITGLQQMGIDVSIISQLLTVLVAAAGGGLALAFAIGARHYVANLVSRSMVARYSPGDEIRVADIEGVVIDIHRTGVDLSTEHGVVTIPAAMFAEHPVWLQRTAGSSKT